MAFDREFLLCLGDSSLILGQQLSAWCGHGPILEEDIATTNVALDLIGHARYWLDLVGEIEGGGRDADDYAYFRDPEAFRNLVLTECPNGDFGDTLMRQFYFDAWHYLVLGELSQSADERVAGIAGKAVKEVRYHLQRSGDWVVRLGDGTEESHRRVQASAESLWRFTGEMFEPADAGLIDAGLAADTAALRDAWRDHVARVFADATLALPDGPMSRAGIGPGRHTEHLGFILAEMQSLRRTHPEATW